MKRGGDLLLPDTDGSWSTFALAPVSLKTWVYIAFDGEITDREIKKAMRILELALDWVPPGDADSILTPEDKGFGNSEPPEAGVLTMAIPPEGKESEDSRPLESATSDAADIDAAKGKES